MFVGHAALALGAKRVAPSASLGVLVAATLGLDFLWPVFALAGFERFSIVPGYTPVTPLRFDHYPWSHSLVMAVVWGAAAAGLIWLYTRRVSDAWITGGLVVSHWILDAVAHVPDLPLWPGASAVVGLGLWRSLPATLAIEGALLAGGIALYVSVRRERASAARIPLVLTLLVMIVIWLLGPFSPPPPSTSVVSWSALALLVLPVWMGWIDRRRANTPGTDHLPVS